MRPSDYQVFRFSKNNKGLNTRDSIADMDSGFASDILNIDFSVTGAIRKRRGYTAVNTRVTEDECVGLVDYKTKAGVQYAVAVFEDKIYKMDGFDGDWDDITGAVSLTDDQDNHMSMIVGQNTVIGTNMSDAPMKWTGSGNAATLTIANFTHAKYVTYYKNRLLFANITEAGPITYPNRIRWSNVGTIETYTSTDWSDEAGTDDGSEIVGLAQLFDEVYIFKNSISSGIKKVYYTGNATAPFGIINIGEVGAVSGSSIVQVDIPGVGTGFIYWGIDNKIRFFDGTKSISIADHIQPTLDDLNLARNKYIQAVNYPDLNQIWFSVSNGSSTTHNRIIVYDYLNRAFLIHNNILANKMAILRNNTGDRFLCTGDYAGITHRQNTGNDDNGEDFDSYYWTAWLNLGDPTLAKKFKWLELYIAELGDYSLTLGYNFDFKLGSKKSKFISLSVGAALFGTARYGVDVFSGQTVLIKTIPIFGTNKERYVRFKFENLLADQPFIIYRYDIIAKFLGIKNKD